MNNFGYFRYLALGLAIGASIVNVVQGNEIRDLEDRVEFLEDGETYYLGAPIMVTP